MRAPVVFPILARALSLGHRHAHKGDGHGAVASCAAILHQDRSREGLDASRARECIDSGSPRERNSTEDE